jgi:tetratricopeptide (TPR) repeat protein
VLTRKLAVLAVAVPLALAVLLAPATRAAAQVTAEEHLAYTAWYDATQAKDAAKAMEAAKQYLAQYPTGQYAESIKKWMDGQKMVALDAAIKEKRTADMVAIGREVLANDPENLLVLYQMAFTIYSTELLAGKLDRLPDAVEFVGKAAPLIEAGKTPAGATSFDKGVALGWMTQVLAMNAKNAGNTDEAIALYQKSSSLAPTNAALVTRNLLEIFSFKQAAYAEAVKAFKTLPEADQQAPDAKPEAKAALERVNAEADAMIDAGAAFVAFATAKGVAAAMRDRVKQTVEAVYKSRKPEDTALEGLQKLLQEKEAALAGAPAAPAAPGD